MSPLVSAALAGAATGARSFTGVAAVLVTTTEDAVAQPERALSNPVVKGIVALAAAQEWVLDKLPQTPSRLEPFGLGARVVCAAGCGALLARRGAALDSPPVPGEPTTDADEPSPRLTITAAVLAAGAAAATARLGVRWRAWSASTVGRDWPGAVLEDATSLGLAVAAVRAS